MAKIVIKDLVESEELDAHAMRAVVGGARTKGQGIAATSILGTGVSARGMFSKKAASPILKELYHNKL